MAADVQIHEMTSAIAGVNKTNGTIRFKSAEDTAVDLNNRLQIPTSGTNYSFTKQLRLYINSTPDVDVSNLQAYSDGSNNFGTGIGVQYDTSGSFATQTDVSINGTDLFTKTSGSPITMDQHVGGPFTSTGYIGDFLRLQMSVADTASTGVLTAEQITMSYDES